MDHGREDDEPGGPSSAIVSTHFYQPQGSSGTGYRSLPHTPILDDETMARSRARDEEIMEHHSKDDDEDEQKAAAVQLGRTLLPFPLAQAVTLTTRSASIMFRLGTAVGGLTFGATKAATLSGFDLSRVVVEGILSRAGKDVLASSRTQFGRMETENMIEKALAAIHRTIAGAAFFTATGFQLVEMTASNVHDVTQLLLSFADQLLGSTESSRAIASILTLIRREFQNPATGVEGERVGMIDLFVGLCGMAYLQRWCRALVEEENRRLEVDEVVWDVVVTTKDSLYGAHKSSYNTQDREQMSSLVEGATNNAVINAIQTHNTDQSGDEDDDLPEIHLKNQILRSLPDEANVSITTETTTSKTITVDISGASPPSLSPPPGVELIEHGPSSTGRPDAPTYRFVYRVDKNSFRTTDMRRRDSDQLGLEESTGFVEPLQDTSSEDDGMEDALELRPTVPPKSPVTIRTPESSSQIPRPASPPSPSTVRASQLPVAASPKAAPESANQKRLRAPLKPSSSSTSVQGAPAAGGGGKPPHKKAKVENGISKPAEKKSSGFRTALKKGAGPALSNLLRKDSSDHVESLHPPRKSKTAPVSPISPTAGSSATFSHPPTTPKAKPPTLLPSQMPSHTPNPAPSRVPPSMIPKREAPPPPNKLTGSPIGKGTSRQSGVNPESIPRSSSRASYVAVHERKRDSMVSQTDTYSIHTIDSNRPISPTLLRTDVVMAGDGSSSGGGGRASRGGGGPVPSMAKSRSEKDMSDQFPSAPSSPAKHHRRARSQNPSIYTLRTSDSQTSLVLSSSAYFSRSAYGDSEALSGLRRTGMVNGMFPKAHLLRNITRYMLFSSASYGSNFLKVMGISKQMSLLQVLDDNTHHELTSFAHHTESEPGSILLSSFVDPQGGSDSTGSTNTGVPLVHYISLDKEAKAVVLACRGTLGFEDVLADMTCDYDDLLWRGRSYKVHKGIHASARRLLYGGDGRVLATLKAALEEYKDYGLVLCGHSLGGAVTALLGVMLSEPAATGTSFVTSAEPHHRIIAAASTQPSATDIKDLCLPTGRPIHVFAYGPPGTMSASLRKATRGLITSVVQGNDLVPHLSLGVLHDAQAVALAIKNDNIDAKMEIRQRLWTAFQEGLSRSWYRSTGRGGGEKNSSQPPLSEDDTWAFVALKTLRANMMSMKLLPPGEVLTVESSRVLRRDDLSSSQPSSSAEGGGGGGGDCEPGVAGGGAYHPVAGAGLPARRIVLKYVRDVEARFREVRFAGSMLTDHSPGRYEDALSLLKQGVIPS